MRLTLGTHFSGRLILKYSYLMTKSTCTFTCGTKLVKKILFMIKVSVYVKLFNFQFDFFFTLPVFQTAVHVEQTNSNMCKPYALVSGITKKSL